MFLDCGPQSLVPLVMGGWYTLAIRSTHLLILFFDLKTWLYFAYRTSLTVVIGVTITMYLKKFKLDQIPVCSIIMPDFKQVAVIWLLDMVPDLWFQQWSPRFYFLSMALTLDAIFQWSSWVATVCMPVRQLMHIQVQFIEASHQN